MSDDRVTWWAVYRQALIPGDYDAFWQLCYRAARQGMSANKLELAVDAAFITNVGGLIGIGLLLGWVLS